MSNTFFQGGQKIFQGGRSPLRPHSYGPECTYWDRQMHPRLGTPALSCSLNTDQLQKFAVFFDIHAVIFLKYLHQKGHNTVDCARWRNNTTAQRGPASRSCIGPHACWGRPWLHLYIFCNPVKNSHTVDFAILRRVPAVVANKWPPLRLSAK